MHFKNRMGKPKNFCHSQFNCMSHWRGSIDDMAQCPYNPKHILKYGRLQLHIVKCQEVFERKHPELAKELMICPYSTLHRFPKNKLQKHLKECKEHMMSVHSRVNAGQSPYVIREVDEKNDRSLPFIHIAEEFDPAYVAEWI